MSVKKWHQLAEEKSAVDQQEQKIHQKFRMDKINKEFGQLSEMDEFDITNPFGDEFRPDAPTPAPSPPTTPTTTRTPIVPTSLPPPYQEFDDLPLPPPPLMEETVIPGISKDETREETSKRLRNVKSILAKFGSDPTYKVKSKGSKYYGYNVEELEAEAFKLETIKAHQEHAEKLLKRKQPLLTQLQEKKAILKPTEKQEKKEKLLKPLLKKLS